MEMDKKLIVIIFAPTTSTNKGKIGTGYPIAEDLILTSRHVVEPEQRDSNYPLRIRWHHLSDKQENDGWQEVPGRWPCLGGERRIRCRIDSLPTTVQSDWERLGAYRR